METNQMTHEQRNERIMKINDDLKEAGMDWEQIDRFWAKLFKEHANPQPGVISKQ